MLNNAVGMTTDPTAKAGINFALETNGSPDARGTLEAWANGAAGAHLTEQAKQALGRLNR